VAASICFPLQADVVIIVANAVARVNAAARVRIAPGRRGGFRPRSLPRWTGMKTVKARVDDAYDVLRNGAVE